MDMQSRTQSGTFDVLRDPSVTVINEAVHLFEFLSDVKILWHCLF